MWNLITESKKRKRAFRFGISYCPSQLKFFLNLARLFLLSESSESPTLIFGSIVKASGLLKIRNKGFNCNYVFLFCSKNKKTCIIFSDIVSAGWQYFIRNFLLNCVQNCAME